MKIETWKLERIIPYARNARKISDAAIDKVAASIKEFGWRQPTVVDAEGVIIVGHVRLKAAQKLGLTEAPIHVADNLTPGQVRAYRLMDNRSHDEAQWDLELIGPELADLQGLDFDLTLTGFDEREIEAFLADPDLVDQANQVPDVPENPVTIPGDVRLCGKHRVLCEDSTQPDTVARLLGECRPILMVTDPPYGISLDSEWRDRART